LIYTAFLIKNNRTAEAVHQLDIVVRSANEHTFAYQNAEPFYFEPEENQRAIN